MSSLASVIVAVLGLVACSSADPCQIAADFDASPMTPKDAPSLRCLGYQRVADIRLNGVCVVDELPLISSAAAEHAGDAVGSNLDVDSCGTCSDEPCGEHFVRFSSHDQF